MFSLNFIISCKFLVFCLSSHSTLASFSAVLSNLSPNSYFPFFSIHLLYLIFSSIPFSSVCVRSLCIHCLISDDAFLLSIFLTIHLSSILWNSTQLVRWILQLIFRKLNPLSWLLLVFLLGVPVFFGRSLTGLFLIFLSTLSVCLSMLSN